MAVYTKLSKEQLVNFFKKYDLGKLLNFNEITDGIENTNYFIKTEKGKFILTLYEKIFAPVSKFLSLLFNNSIKPCP